MVPPGVSEEILRVRLTPESCTEIVLTSEKVVVNNFHELFAALLLAGLLLLPFLYLPRHLDIAALNRIRSLNEKETLVVE